MIRTLAALHLDLILRPCHDALARVSARLDEWLCDYGNDDPQGDL